MGSRGPLGWCRRFFLFGLSHKECSHGGKKDQKGEQLCHRHITTEDESPLIPAKAFYEQSGCAVKNQEPEKELTLELFLGMEVIEGAKNNEPAQRTV